MDMKFKAIFLLLLVAGLSFATDYVSINSMDGRDVLSGIFYANVIGVPSTFMPAPGGNLDVYAAKLPADSSVLLIQSSTLPASGFVETSLKNKGNSVEVYSSQDGGTTNLDLAKRSGAAGFIIVDTSYSDSALSVLPYAAMKKYYVIMADKSNIDQVKGIVSGKQVIIYGYVDQAVKDGLASMNPQIIGKGNDRYEDNVAIVSQTISEFHISQAIAVDGTFIEEGMTKGDLPILFVSSLTPPVTYNFVKQSVKDGSLSGLLLIGSDLTFPMYDMRQKVTQDLSAEGVSKTLGVTVKFAQAVPIAGGSVLALDTFRLPAYKPELKIGDFSYNKATKKFQLSLANTGQGPAYYSSEIKIKLDGQDYKLLDDANVKLVERGAVSGDEYALDLSGVTSGAVTADIVVRYGSSSLALQELATATGPVATIDFVDNTQVVVQAAKYDSTKKEFEVTLHNTGTDKAFVMSKVSFNLSGQMTSISSQTTGIDGGSLYVMALPLDINLADIDAKSGVATASYGGREGFLAKTSNMAVDFGSVPASGNDIAVIAAACIVVVLILAGAYYLLAGKNKGKKEEPKDGEEGEEVTKEQITAQPPVQPKAAKHGKAGKGKKRK